MCALDVQLQFTEDRYRANELNVGGSASFMDVVVSKASRIASRIVLEVVSLTVQQAREMNITLPPNIPANDPYSPPYASVMDFNNTAITLIFEPDEDAEVPVNEMSARIPIVDDDINEATEQVFIVHLRLISSVNRSRVDFSTRPSSLCRIIDNDRK